MTTLIKNILEEEQIKLLQPDFKVLKIIPQDLAQQAQLLTFSSPGKKQLQALTTNNFPEASKQLIAQLQHKGFDVELFYTNNEGFQLAFQRYQDMQEAQDAYADLQFKRQKADGKSAIHLIQELFEQREQMDPGEFIKEIIRLAFQAGASDLHFQPEEKGVLMKTRIDGMLFEIVHFEHQDFWKYMQKIKFISGVKMNIDYLPQDGRFSFEASDRNGQRRTIDARVSFMPGVKTESVVMRFLDAQTAVESFEEIWFSPWQIQLLEQKIKKTTGIIVITGPTGSGKTTTLYTILKKLNTWEKKIITLEDPIEYKISGLQQSQINYEKGYNYELGLKAILRQDPDIILIWETRTAETANIAINAALTGHLVFTTLHTNSALDSLTRLLNMGVESYLLTPALQLIVGQRLVRRLCPHCKQKIQANAEQLQVLQNSLSKLQKIDPKIWSQFDGTLFQAEGCEYCNHSGYLGRIAILELLELNDQLKTALLHHQHDQLQHLLGQQGFLSLQDDAMLKVISGETTIEEAYRVIY